MIKYLQDRSYYEDLYDKWTIEEALRQEDFWLNKAKDKNGKKLSNSFAKRGCHLSLYVYTGERYLKREESINEWMESDRKKDDLLENAPMPEANCFMCGDPMQFTHKHLKTDYKKDVSSVEFVFHCEECKVLSVFKGQSREDRVPWQCPDCKRKLEIKDTRKGEIIVTKEHCSFCGYNDEYKLDLTIEPEKESPNKAELKKFRENRLRFCLSAEAGSRYMQSKMALERINKLMGEIEKNPKKPKVQTLSIKEVQKRLKTVLKSDGCENITFSDPDTAKDVVFGFKAIDSKERNAYDIKKSFKKVIKTEFEGTNWSLMSEGISYRLGILEGKLRGKEYI